MVVRHQLLQTLYSNKAAVIPGTRDPSVPVMRPATPGPSFPQTGTPQPSTSSQPNPVAQGSAIVPNANTTVGQDNVGKLARDAQRVLNDIPVNEQRILEDFYREPIVMGSLREEPFCIELVRILNLFAQTTPVTTGGMCHFIWLPAQGGANITSIDGMSVAINGTTKFRFYFRITYRMG